VSPTRRNRSPASDQELLDALWLISHFGWIAEATIRRTLMISDAQRILAAGLAERLRQLLNRGWVERRHNDAGTDEPEWRLTESGRDALAHRG
jgi:DNA-binding HxlR family transcriptional regulator